VLDFPEQVIQFGNPVSPGRSIENGIDAPRGLSARKEPVQSVIAPSRERRPREVGQPPVAAPRSDNAHEARSNGSSGS
jgi:hypothetical protein